MSGDSISRDPGEESLNELDGVFRALAHSKRRAILQILEEGEELELEELATAITEDEQSLSKVKINLVHCHLPQLADVGIVSYGGDYVCKLDNGEMPLCLLETAHNQSSTAPSP